MEKYPPEQALNPSFQQEAAVCRHELQRAAGGKEPGRSHRGARRRLAARCRRNTVGTSPAASPACCSPPPGLLGTACSWGDSEVVTRSLLPKTHPSNPKTALAVGLSRAGRAALGRGRRGRDVLRQQRGAPAAHVRMGIAGRIRTRSDPTLRVAGGSEREEHLPEGSECVVLVSPCRSRVQGPGQGSCGSCLHTCLSLSPSPVF